MGDDSCVTIGFNFQVELDRVRGQPGGRGNREAEVSTEFHSTLGRDRRQSEGTVDQDQCSR